MAISARCRKIQRWNGAGIAMQPRDGRRMCPPDVLADEGGTGEPDGAGQSNGVGQPNGTRQPNGAGQPNVARQSNGAGLPNYKPDSECT